MAMPVLPLPGLVSSNPCMMATPRRSESTNVPAGYSCEMDDLLLSLDSWGDADPNYQGLYPSDASSASVSSFDMQDWVRFDAEEAPIALSMHLTPPVSLDTPIETPSLDRGGKRSWDDMNSSSIQGELLQIPENVSALSTTLPNGSFDTTMPYTDDDKRGNVALIMKAFKNTENAQDSERIIAPFRSDRYTDAQIEKASWDILAALITRQTTGFSLTGSNKQRDTGTFESRFVAVIEALEVSKSICKHLLDPPYMISFIDDPKGACKRVMSNKSVNDRKATQIKAGKKVLNKQVAGF